MNHIRTVKWQATLVLLSVSIVAPIASAQSSAEPPSPEIAPLIQQTISRQRAAESKEQDYLFREDVNINKLRKECTWAPDCGGPTSAQRVSIPYQVLAYTTRKFEIFWLDGMRVARILPPCDDCGKGQWQNYVQDIPVSKDELAEENKRIDSEIAEAKALRAQGKDPSSPDAPPQILFSRMLELCAFSNPRRQIVNGRSTILLDFAWNPSAKPVSDNEAILQSFSGTVMIDEEDHGVQEVEGRFLTDVKLSGRNIRIRKGTRVTLTNVRVDAGIWLLSTLEARGEARYFSFALDGDGHIFVGLYRKFRTSTRILP